MVVIPAQWFHNVAGSRDTEENHHMKAIGWFLEDNKDNVDPEFMATLVEHLKELDTHIKSQPIEGGLVMEEKLLA